MVFNPRCTVPEFILRRYLVRKRIGDGGSLTASLRSDKEVVLAPDGDGSHRQFCGVVVQLKDTAVEIPSIM